MTDPMPFGAWNVADYAERLRAPSWRDRLNMKPIRQVAGKLLTQLYTARLSALKALDEERRTNKHERNQLIDVHRQELRAAKEGAKEIKARIDSALDDFTRSQHAVSWSRREEPFGIILSPYQFERMSWSSRLDRTETEDGIDKRRVRVYKNLPIYTAKGLVGPLVVSKAGMDGLSRQAPELMLLSK